MQQLHGTDHAPLSCKREACPRRQLHQHEKQPGRSLRPDDTSPRPGAHNVQQRFLQGLGHSAYFAIDRLRHAVMAINDTTRGRRTTIQPQTRWRTARTNPLVADVALSPIVRPMFATSLAQFASRHVLARHETARHKTKAARLPTCPPARALARLPVRLHACPPSRSTAAPIANPCHPLARSPARLPGRFPPACPRVRPPTCLPALLYDRSHARLHARPPARAPT